MRTTAALSFLLLLACASAPAPRTQYLLRGELVERAERMSPVRVGLGRIRVAPYLDQAGIIVETDSGQIRAANHHEWAEPLAAGIRSLLRAELAADLGQEVAAEPGPGLPWDYTVDVAVERLHATMEGDALLDAAYWITPPPDLGEIATYRFSRSTPLAREGYAGVVEAEAALTRALAAAIAGSLREIGGAAPH